MPHRLILKVTKFQLPPSKRLGTMVKNILGGHHAPPPMSNRVKSGVEFDMGMTFCMISKTYTTFKDSFTFGVNVVLIIQSLTFLSLQRDVMFCPE